MGAAKMEGSVGSVLVGEEALRYAEGCGLLVQMADVSEVRPGRARALLQMAKAPDRALLLAAITVRVR